MSGDLINGVFRPLGELPDAPRRGLLLAHSLVTGELVTVAVPARRGESPTAAELRLEGDLYGSVVHPNVHRIVDWGTDEVFVAWEYVAAWPLSDTLAAGRAAGVGTVLRLLHDLGSALGAVHSQGVLYRGLHPGRVLVGRDGRARLATCPESLSTGRGRVVEAGPPAETPIRYLPPEQIEGTVDGRSDIYTLAAIAFELLTGRRLYQSADPVTLAVQILATPPELPSQLRDGVPPAVDELFMHCLARDPGQRPANAAALLAHVKKLLDAVDGAADPLVGRPNAAPTAFPLPRETEAEEAMEALEAVPATAARMEALGFAARGGSNGTTPADERGDEPEPVVVPVDAPYVQETPEAPEAVAANGESAPGDATPAGNESGAPGVNGAGAGDREPAMWPEPIAVNGHVGVEPMVALVGPDGRRVRLAGERLLIGRGDGVDVHTGLDLGPWDAGQVVSREHAVIERMDGAWVCRDLGATNGTYVNGSRLSSEEVAALKLGDRVRFANVELALEELPEPTNE